MANVQPNIVLVPNYGNSYTINDAHSQGETNYGPPTNVEEENGYLRKEEKGRKCKVEIYKKIGREEKYAGQGDLLKNSKYVIQFVDSVRYLV
ncbi:hypothetical protein JTB14_025092 [Gonioctena quinquepunctata]|nr:hypothetical protein JTB14_025092 [Gonioctena quinquepunctata]